MDQTNAEKIAIELSPNPTSIFVGNSSSPSSSSQASDASIQLRQHECSKLSAKDVSKVSDFDIENTYEYGLRLVEGKYGYPKDLKKAREIFVTLTNSFNHCPSNFFFGFMIFQGLGGNEDEKLGEELMQQSSITAKNYFESHTDDSLGFSEFAIGFIHFKGYDVPEDDSKALSSFQTSANKGNSFSQRMIGQIYRFGFGVETNLSLAFDYYKKSALQGNCIAQHDLGVLFEDGDGIQQDFNEAFKYFKLSADQEYPPAQNSMGFLYFNGYGVPVDKEKAVQLFKLAAENGDDFAQYSLANRLENGEGIAKDLNTAIMWHKKAADQGQDLAKKALERLKKQVLGI